MIERVKAFVAAYAVKGLLLALLAVGGFAAAQTVRLSAARADLASTKQAAAEADARAQAAARSVEHQLYAAAVDAAVQYERGKADAKTAADALLVGLLNRDVRLHARWQCPVNALVPATAESAGKLNEADRDRAASASRIVGAARACDEKVAAWQRFYSGVVRSYEAMETPAMSGEDWNARSYVDVVRSYEAGGK